MTQQVQHNNTDDSTDHHRSIGKNLWLILADSIEIQGARPLGNASRNRSKTNKEDNPTLFAFKTLDEKYQNDSAIIDCNTAIEEMIRLICVDTNEAGGYDFAHRHSEFGSDIVVSEFVICYDEESREFVQSDETKSTNMYLKFNGFYDTAIQQSKRLRIHIGILNEDDVVCYITDNSGDGCYLL